MGKIYFTCSFDDGHVADLRLAELLAKFNVKATFYIPRSCEWCSASLAENEIRTLSSFIEVGGHTMTHPILTKVSYKQARNEIFDCKHWLEDVTGKAIRSFCPPVGRFNKDHVSLQREAGFTSMRTVEMLTHSMGSVKKVRDFVILPTTCQVYNHSNISYLKNNVKRMKFVSYISAWRLFDANWETMSRNFLNYLYSMSLTQQQDHYFHLWGHSWELSQFSLWQSLERFFACLREVGGFEFIDNSTLAEVVRQGRQEVALNAY